MHSGRLVLVQLIEHLPLNGAGSESSNQRRVEVLKRIMSGVHRRLRKDSATTFPLAPPRGA